jgi:hypothetical protein
MAQIPTITATPIPHICILTYHPLIFNLTHSTQFTQYLVVPMTPNYVLWLFPPFYFFPTKGISQVSYILNMFHVTIYSIFTSLQSLIHVWSNRCQEALCFLQLRPFPIVVLSNHQRSLNLIGHQYLWIIYTYIHILFSNQNHHLPFWRPQGRCRHLLHQQYSVSIISFMVSWHKHGACSPHLYTNFHFRFWRISVPFIIPFFLRWITLTVPLNNS